MSVQLRLPGTGARTFTAEIVTLPAKVKMPASPAKRSGGLVIGLFFTIIGYVMFKTALSVSGFDLRTIIGLALGGYGGLTVARALFAPSGQAIMTFHENYVEVSENGWLTKTRWQENYENYKGVRARTKDTPSRRESAPYQIIELVHDNPAKTLPLFATRQDDPPIDHLAHYADILGVETLS